MYTLKQLVDYSTEDIYQAQANEDEANRQYLEEHLAEDSILNTQEKQHLLEYYTDTMEKYRLIYNAFVQAFSHGYVPGYPKNVFNIDLKTGVIETDKDGRRISYNMKVVAPCSTSAMQYIHQEYGKVYVMFPPIKSAKRTLEKIITERTREHEELQKNKLRLDHGITTDEEEPELPFFDLTSKDNEIAFDNMLSRPLLQEKQKSHQNFNSNLSEIAKDELLPKDIYRLSILAKYPGHLERLMESLEKKFPSYIKFESGEINLYKRKLSENKRSYFDIKRTACITLPGSNRSFYIEFQFKQRNMFYAHIRSHRVYEDFRILDAKYKTLLENVKEKGTKNNPKAKTDLVALAKRREEKLKLCEKIHQSAIHQSNFYLMNEIQWLDENAHIMSPLSPENTQLNSITAANEKGQYSHSLQLLADNYIVENYEPFDGVTAFSTNDAEYLNKSYFLKMIGKIPESFDEFGKNAEDHVKKMWSTLKAADVDNFKAITNIAIRYQDVIRGLQKEKQQEDSQDTSKKPLDIALLKTISQNIL